MHSTKIQMSDAPVESYYIVCDHSAINSQKLQEKKPFCFIISCQQGAVLNSYSVASIETSHGFICFCALSPSLPAMIISQNVLHCTLSICLHFISHKLPLFISNLIMVYFSMSIILTSFSSFLLSSSLLKIQLHIYYIFNSINPIRN